MLFASSSGQETIGMTCIFAYQRRLCLLLLLILTLGGNGGNICDIHIQIGQHHIKVFRFKAKLAEIGVYGR